MQSLFLKTQKYQGNLIVYLVGYKVLKVRHHV